MSRFWLATVRTERVSSYSSGLRRPEEGNHDLVVAAADHGPQVNGVLVAAALPLGMNPFGRDAQELGRLGLLAERFHVDKADVHRGAGDLRVLPQEAGELFADGRVIAGDFGRDVRLNLDGMLGVDLLEDVAGRRREAVDLLGRQIGPSAGVRGNVIDADEGEAQAHRPDHVLKTHRRLLARAPMPAADHHQIEIQHEDRQRDEIKDAAQGDQSQLEIVKLFADAQVSQADRWKEPLRR